MVIPDNYNHDVYQIRCLKGIAILLVVLGHLAIIFRGGAFGVEIFLLASGFGLTRQYLSNGLDNFLSRRFGKILLPYSLLMLIEYGIDYVVFDRHHDFLTIILTTLGLNLNWLASIDLSMWYLTFILLWYMCFYFCFRMHCTISCKLISLCSLSLVFYYFRLPLCDHASYYIYVFGFPLGVVFAVFYNQFIKFINKYKWILPLLLFIFAGIFYLSYEISKQTVHGYILNINAAAFLLFLIVPLLPDINFKKVLEIIGGFSFEIYLFEWLLIVPYRRVWEWTTHASINLVIYFCILFILAITYQKLIKRVSNYIFFKPMREVKNEEYSNGQKQDTVFYSSFDYLRAFGAIAVVAIHTVIFGQTEMYISKGINFTVSLPEIFYVNILLLAVPVFIQVSLFLYLAKRKTSAYFIKKIKSIAALWLFWVSVNSLFTGMKIPDISLWLPFFLTAGGSIFYFFSEMLILVCLMEVMLVIKRICKENIYITINIVLLTISLMVFFVRSSILNFIGCDYQYLYSYWSPANFLPYVFTTVLISAISKKEPNLKRYILPAVFLYGLVAFNEWRFLPDAHYVSQNGYAFPSYGRMSLVIAASFLVLYFSVYHYRVPKLVRWLADNSLAIYGIHMFVIRCKLVDVIHLREPISSLNLFVCTLAITTILIYFLKCKRVV